MLWSAGISQEISVREGQAVKKGDVMFKVVAVLYKARLDAELAEVKLAEIEFENTEKLFDRKKRSSVRMRWPVRGQAGEGPGQGEAR